MEKLDRLCVLVAAIMNVFACISTKYASKKNEGGKAICSLFQHAFVHFSNIQQKGKKKWLTYAIETSNVIAVSVEGILK